MRPRSLHARTRRTILKLVFLCPGLLLSGAAGPRAAELEDSLSARLGGGAPVDSFQAHGLFLDSGRILGGFYARRAFAPVWPQEERVGQLLDALRNVESDGLLARDFHLAELEHLHEQLKQSAPPPIPLRVDFELLLTDALARYLRCVRIGKVDPESLDVNWNIAPDRSHTHLDVWMDRALEADTLSTFLAGLSPHEPDFEKLREALARYRAVKAAGGWGTLSPGRPLQMKSRDPAVQQLRFHLAVTGDLRTPSPSEGIVYDRSERDGVLRFQRRHALKETGKVDRATLAELNVPVERRIEQIRVNLERNRWVMHDLPDTFVVVNIAGFRLHYVMHDSVVWKSRVQVGKVARQSPVIRSALSSIIVNPTWTVPPVVLEEDILPAGDKIPEVLEQKQLKVYGRHGQEIDPDKLDWSKYTARTFPYELRQVAGPNNALGQIKFNFPNRFSVFLHDTPRRSYFKRDNRAVSSGCIRVENPLRLAELALGDSVHWGLDSLVRAEKAGMTRRIGLRRPVTILLLYWTAWVDENGEIRFSRDIYGRDDAILKGLDSEFHFRPQPGMRSVPETHDAQTSTGDASWDRRKH